MNGQRICCETAPAAGLVRLYGPDERFLGMGKVPVPGVVAAKRLFRTDR